MKSFKDFLNKKTLSPSELAKQHDLPLETIMSSLEDGIATEMEHTNQRGVAKEIALDHLGEDPKYYEKLKKAKL